MTDTPKMQPLTTTAIGILASQNASELVIHTAEGIDIVRQLTVEGHRQLAIGMTKLMAADPHSAAVAIGILIQVACKADELIAQGQANFEAIPEELQEKLKTAAGG